MKTPIFCLLPLCLLACSEPAMQNTAPASTPAASAVATANAAQSNAAAMLLNTLALTHITQTATWQSLLEQAITLRKQVQEVLPHASPEQANALYDEHVRIMNQLLTKLNDVDSATLENYFMQVEYDEQTKTEIVPPELLAKQKQLQAAGLQYADAGEGMAMITIVPDYYATLFGKQLSPDYHAYVAIQAEHNKQTSIKDGGLAISYDDFGKRLADWENFVATYPDSKKQVFSRCQMRTHRDIFLLGLDNTPTFEFDNDKKLVPESAQAWQNFVARHPDSPTTAIIQSLQGKMSKKNMEAALNQIQPNTENSECDFGDQYIYIF